MGENIKIDLKKVELGNIEWIIWLRIGIRSGCCESWLRIGTDGGHL